MIYPLSLMNFARYMVVKGQSIFVKNPYVALLFEPCDTESFYSITSSVLVILMFHIYRHQCTYIIFLRIESLWHMPTLRFVDNLRIIDKEENLRFKDHFDINSVTTTYKIALS